jgi:hypothetical protein
VCVFDGGGVNVGVLVTSGVLAGVDVGVIVLVFVLVTVGVEEFV